jgi:hypothetical protein
MFMRQMCSPAPIGSKLDRPGFAAVPYIAAFVPLGHVVVFPATPTNHAHNAAVTATSLAIRPHRVVSCTLILTVMNP